MRHPKAKKSIARKQRRLSEVEEIELLDAWIESGRPDSGSNPLAFPPPPPSAPVGRLADGGFSPYVGCKLFQQLSISQKTKDGLKPKYTEMSEIQRASLPHTLSGRDVVGAAKTGSGKTLAFIIPGFAGTPAMDSNQEEANAGNDSNESPQLLVVLKEMMSGLDTVRAKVQALTLKVKEGQFPTIDGISYLETKHLLLLSYCQSIVYYFLRKAKGLPIEGHPVVRSLVEIRLFLEKIRPIDKKLEYQIQKLTKAATNLVPEKAMSIGEEREEEKKDEEDALKFRPNPDMLVSKSAPADKDGGGVYRPPRFAPASMENDKLSKQEKQAIRKDKQLLRQARENAYFKELMDDMEDKPEEIREFYGTDSKEVERYKAKREARDKQEEELFTRAPISKREKRLERHMLKSRNGLLGLTDGFNEEMRMLPLEGKDKDTETNYGITGSGRKRFKKRKRKH